MKNTLSIAYLLMQMPAPAEVFLSVEINALMKAGAEVHVFSLRNPHPKHEQLVVDQKLEGVRLHNFAYVRDRAVWADVRYWRGTRPGIFQHMVSLITKTCWRRPKLLAKSLAILPKSFRIARVVEQAGIQAVHAAWGHHPAITGYLIKKLMPHVGFSLALGAYDRLLRHPMTVVAANVADVMVTQSQASAVLLREEWPRPGTPIQVVYRGVDLPNLRPYRTVASSPTPLIVSVGRLTKDKGHHHLLTAFAEVKKDLPAANLLILGEGVYRRELEQLVDRLNLGGAVRMPGHLPHDDLFHYVAQAHVFVLASESKADNLPNSVKEAMALHVPVITTPTTGMDELIINGETGFIMPMGHVGVLKERLMELLTNPFLSQNISEQARRHVAGTFSVEQTTQVRLACLMTMVSGI